MRCSGSEAAVARAGQLLAHLTPAGASAEDGVKSFDEMPGPWKEVSDRDKRRALVEYLYTEFVEGRRSFMLHEYVKQYGPIVRTTFYRAEGREWHDFVLVADADEATRILQANPPKARDYQRFLLLGHGVLSTTDPAEWHRQRTELKAAFAVDQLRRLLPGLQRLTERLCVDLAEHAQKSTPFNMQHLLLRHTFSMIVHSALSEEAHFLEAHAAELQHAFDTCLFKATLQVRPDEDKEYRQAIELIERLATTAFKRRADVDAATAARCPHAASSAGAAKSSGSGASLLSIILAKDENGQPKFTPRQQIDQLSTFLFAGHETTANTLSWALYELARHPDVQERLRAEIRGALQQRGDTTLDYQDLFKLPYLTKVINETLRLWPVVPAGTTRVTTEPTVICGYRIPPGIMLSFPHISVHRDPAIWDRPNEFDPDRKWHNKAFMPFTRPPRDCLGRNLAMMEMRTILIAVINRFRVRLVANDETRPMDLITLRPDNLITLVEFAE